MTNEKIIKLETIRTTENGDLLIPNHMLNDTEENELKKRIVYRISGATKIELQKDLLNKKNLEAYNYNAASYYMGRANTLLLIGSIFLFGFFNNSCKLDGCSVKDQVALGMSCLGLFLLLIGIREYFFANAYVENKEKHGIRSMLSKHSTHIIGISAFIIYLFALTLLGLTLDFKYPILYGSYLVSFLVFAIVGHLGYIKYAADEK
jgi:hypothetical protein